MFGTGTMKSGGRLAWTQFSYLLAIEGDVKSLHA